MPAGASPTSRTKKAEDTIHDSLRQCRRELHQYRDLEAWCMKMFDFKPGYSTYLRDIGADFLVLKRDDLKVELISQKGSRRSETADLVPPAHVSVAYIIAIAFSSDDLEADTAALEANGAVFVWKNLQLSDDGLKSSMLRDPDGNMVNVLQYPS